jgi:hypothetical protein
MHRLRGRLLLTVLACALAIVGAVWWWNVRTKVYSVDEAIHPIASQGTGRAKWDMACRMGSRADRESVVARFLQSPPKDGDEALLMVRVYAHDEGRLEERVLELAREYDWNTGFGPPGSTHAVAALARNGIDLRPKDSK